jgi:hypothetical protein
MSREVVIARYAEHLGWVNELHSDAGVTIYDKGSPGPELVGLFQHRREVRHSTRPNVGREAHTYLTHITERWDSLADWTVFCQGSPHEHMAQGKTINTLLDQFSVDSLQQGRFIHFLGSHPYGGPEWDWAGRINWPPAWQAQVEYGLVAPASMSLLEWFRKKLGIDLVKEGKVQYSAGAVFGVSRRGIFSRPKEFYEGLLADLSHHAHPEEAHYMERAWMYIFTRGAKANGRINLEGQTQAPAVGAVV